MNHHSSFLQLCKSVKNEITEITIEEFELQKKQGTPHILIDVREDHEWNEGAIPDAIHIGRGILERDIEGVFPDCTTKIILYCGGGFRSALAAKTLQEMGYNNVFSLSGGVRGWKEFGFFLK